MDYTPNLDAIRERGRQAAALLKDSRVVLCLGNRVILSVWVAGSMASRAVVGAATTAAEGLALVERLAPSLLVVSDQLEQGSGIDLLLAVKARWPDLAVLVVVGRQQRRRQLRQAMAAGCEGLVPESRFGQGAGLAALSTIAGGGIYLDRTLRALIQGWAPGEGPLELLSPRELEVLSLVARGTSNAEIARSLFLSVDTVKTHLHNVLRKLPARDRAHAAVLGLCWDLIDWPDP
ncbi:response regulator transcription factor [Cyanobium sp. LEGE 06143]|uniref:response regulator transcription factor n=1 Tax=unclassified Cyanobium TaxID=2627006 RepID=UPI00187FDAE2|nr:response regulator transcription factor [Cyanobium sp. LEGE 06113]MBE9173693.1 response regulator transcription factor [Cyanobium sp. LEGE 06143]